MKPARRWSRLRADDSSEVLGVNTRIELAELDAKLRDKKARELMLAGTTIFRPETCDIDADVEIGTDTVIEPFVQLIGETKIGADCRIRSYSVITNCANWRRSSGPSRLHPGRFHRARRRATWAVLAPAAG